MDADVCVVGAGYTGLWTAWSLLSGDPGLTVVIVEAARAGHGASGRNGGWLSGLLPGDRELLARGPGGRNGVVALQRQLIESVQRVTAICADEGIDADIIPGGTLAVATTGSELVRLRAELEEDRRWGLSEEDVAELGAAETAARVAVSGARGGVFSPHCARIQPAKLARGLASCVERQGARIYECSPATAIYPGRVSTANGRVKAPWVVIATEGYTAGLPGLHRRLLPMNSSMIVTDPLPPEAWGRIGWEGRETLKDGAHAYVYLQRTADDRIAIGGRGIPYRFGSSLAGVGRISPSTVAALSESLSRLFPVVSHSGAPPVAAGWSGVLGVARDWCPSVVVERSPDGGLAWAGGYVGDGVATSHLAGLTLADLILDRDTERTALPWVGRRPRNWEPEPLRWLGVRAVYRMYRSADRIERQRPSDARTALPARLADRLAGRH